MAAPDENLELVESIKSGQYFIDARNWYIEQCLYPFVARSHFISLLIVLAVILLTLFAAIREQLPTVYSVKYAINVTTVDNTRASITHILEQNGPAKEQISKILLKNYVQNRERYDYDNLTRQIEFVKNNSTPEVFTAYYDYMNLNNPESPVLRYQKYGLRDIIIDSVKLSKDNQAIVRFRSSATNFDGVKFEDALWEAQIHFAQDEINTKAQNQTEYHFMVNSYTIKLVK